MATFSSIVSFFFPVVFFLVSVAQGVGDNENVKKACAGSPFPDTCISTLSSYNGTPLVKNADAHAMAGIMVLATANALGSASSIASVQVYDHEDLSYEDSHCFIGCSDDMYNASKKLEATYGHEDAVYVNLAKVRSFLKEAREKHVQWNCDRCRHGEMKNKVDEISKGNEAEKNMAVLSVLVDRATK